jgi:hypothetical protein
VTHGSQMGGKEQTVLNTYFDLCNAKLKPNVVFQFIISV